MCFMLLPLEFQNWEVLIAFGNVEIVGDLGLKLFE